MAILVNLVASLPGAIKALLDGTIHSRVPATILIAVGAFIPTLTDSLNRFGTTELFQLGKFLGVVFLFAGLPRLDRGLPRHPHPVHLDPLAVGTARIAGRRAHRERGRGRRPEPRGPPGDRPRSTDRRLRYHPDMAPSPRPPLFGFAVVLLGATLFGTLGPVSHFVYEAGMEPIPFVAWRALLGALTVGRVRRVAGPARHGTAGPARQPASRRTDRRSRSRRPVAPG